MPDDKKDDDNKDDNEKKIAKLASEISDLMDQVKDGKKLPAEPILKKIDEFRDAGGDIDAFLPDQDVTMLGKSILRQEYLPQADETEAETLVAGIIQRDANINTKSGIPPNFAERYPPVQIAFTGPIHFPAAARLILHEKDIEIDATSPDNNTVLHLADAELMPEILSKQPALDKQNAKDETALFVAADKKNLEKTEALLAAHANTEIPIGHREGNAYSDISGFFPIHAASHNAQDAGTVEALIASNANMNSRDAQGRNFVHILALDAPTPVNVMQSVFQFIAAREGKEKVKQLLHEVDRFGNTPLHYAKSAEKVELMLQYGADKDAQNKAGETPVNYILASCKFDDSSTAEAAIKLLDLGADWHIKNKKGQTPLQAAEGNDIHAQWEANKKRQEEINKAMGGTFHANEIPNFNFNKVVAQLRALKQEEDRQKTQQEKNDELNIEPPLPKIVKPPPTVSFTGLPPEAHKDAAPIYVASHVPPPLPTPRTASPPPGKDAGEINRG